MTDSGNSSKPTAEAGRAAVVLFAFYATDARPRREAEALAKAGFQVDVISLRSATSKSGPSRQTINGVNVHLAPLAHRRGGKFRYLFEYALFFASSFWVLSKWSMTKRFKIVHVHNMPDFLLFTALLPRLRGAKLILDLHDPMPELFATIFDVTPDHFASRLLRRIEKWCMDFSDLVLTPNLAFKELFVSRGCAADKIEIIMNTPETEIFHTRQAGPSSTLSEGRSFKLMYHGLLVERHGLDLAVDALASLRPRIPGMELHFDGEETDFLTRLMSQVRQRKLEEAVHFHGFKSLSEIAKAIVQIDLGVIPNRLSSFTRINLPTRIFEYLAMNKPLIVSRTRGVQDYFKEDEILFFEPGNVDDLARKIEWAFWHPDELRSMMGRGRRVYEKYSWELERSRFIGRVNRLIAREENRSRSLVPSTPLPEAGKISGS